MGFLLFLCLTVLTAAVIPRDGSGSSDRFDDASSVRSYWGDLMAVANVTGALRHEAACSLLLTPAAAELCGDEEKIPTSCPTNASSSLPHSQAMIQVLQLTLLTDNNATTPLVYDCSSPQCSNHVHSTAFSEHILDVF